MVIMALDHVRDYFHLSTVDPMGPEASLPLYLSRLITNICAPAFLLLAGVSIGLMATRKSKPELTSSPSFFRIFPSSSPPGGSKSMSRSCNFLCPMPTA